MSDRIKLTLASLTVMMLPYRIDFPLSVLVVTAIISTAIVVLRECCLKSRPYKLQFVLKKFLVS
jgi:hypothetical protein